jgi:hypothetical protein
MPVTTELFGTILDEVQLALMEIASARDQLADYGPQSFQGNQRMSEAIQRMRGTLQELQRASMALLVTIGDSEGQPGAFPGLQERALELTRLVESRGTLDQLLDQLDEFRDVMGREGDWIRQGVRSDVLDARVYLRQIYTNYQRIVGKPLHD